MDLGLCIQRGQLTRSFHISACAEAIGRRLTTTVVALAVSPDGERIACGCADWAVRVFSTELQHLKAGAQVIELHFTFGEIVIFIITESSRVPWAQWTCSRSGLLARWAASGVVQQRQDSALVEYTDGRGLHRLRWNHLAIVATLVFRGEGWRCRHNSSRLYGEGTVS